jgi:hypothetical protein
VCRGGVQLNCGGTRDEVGEQDNVHIKRGSLDSVHGDECEVVEDIHFNSLKIYIVEGCIYTVSVSRGG